MQCTGCGKSLSTDELRGEDCPYCETALPHQNVAMANAAAVKELLRDDNQDGVPDVLEGTHLDPRNQPKKVEISEEERTEVLGPKDMPSKRKLVEYKKKSGGIGCGWLVFIFICPLVSIFGYLFYQNSLETEQHAHGSEGTTTSTTTTTSTSYSFTITTSTDGSNHISMGGESANTVYGACIVDANGDGVGDVLAHTGSHNTPKPVILDGQNGQPLWSDETYNAPVDIVCIDDEWFVVAQRNFQLHFFNSRRLGPPLRVMGSDKLRAIGMGEECIAFKTADGTRTGVALPSGLTQKCKTRTALRSLHERPPGIIPLTGKRTTIKHNDRGYKLSLRRRGTPMLIVAAADNKKKTLWKRELPYQKPTYSTGIAVGDGHVAVIGSPPGEPMKVFLVGLDESTGDQVYEHALSKNQTDHAQLMHYNGHAVLLQYGSSLQAHNIRSGKLLWKIGD